MAISEFVYSSVDEYLDCFYFGAVTSETSLTIHVHLFL